MLELRPDCECCGRALPPDGDEAYICSFECTFCEACVAQLLNGRCPNCKGELRPRPRRVGDALRRHPSSTRSHRRAGSCTPTHPDRDDTKRAPSSTENS